MHDPDPAFYQRALSQGELVHYVMKGSWPFDGSYLSKTHCSTEGQTGNKKETALSPENMNLNVAPKHHPEFKRSDSYVLLRFVSNIDLDIVLKLQF